MSHTGIWESRPLKAIEELYVGEFCDQNCAQKKKNKNKASSVRVYDDLKGSRGRGCPEEALA